MRTTVTSTVRKRGNSLVIRIPDALARKASFAAGQQVTMTANTGGLVIKRTDRTTASLAHLLAAFDPDKHGGEAMPSGRLGAEVF